MAIEKLVHWGAYVLGSYLLGAIPFGLIVAYIFGGGVDPREVGSGNIGATNVARAAGKIGGALTLILDAAKGFVPLYLARRAFPENYYAIVSLCAVAAFLGHVFPVYLRFKGGKGVAIAGGIIIFLSPIAALLLFTIFLFALFFTGYVSVGSLLCALSFPVLMAFLGPTPLYIAIALFMAVMIFFTHRENIRRLVEGRENKFLGKKR
ncbi:MAG: glycerol-3-phosphate 1-O-acyltransferase PlsY [Deltaproteobacteria bacterium]|nr:glycerol-3-phosphate 1-O-acyltransferase PlsY [Deltaproteobacteria bacterium]NIS77048.1 glycerol-3-phosphate 1-O-acyltransferase PlsY [Deltaproteobacteria bacterium]